MAPGGRFLTGLLGLEDPAKRAGRGRRESRHDRPAYTLSPETPQVRIDQLTGRLMIDEGTTHIPPYRGFIPNGPEPPSKADQELIAARNDSDRAIQAAGLYFDRREERRRFVEKRDRARMDLERRFTTLSDAEIRRRYDQGSAQLTIFFDIEYPHIVTYLAQMSTPQKRKVLKIFELEMIRREQPKQPKRLEKQRDHGQNPEENDSNESDKDENDDDEEIERSKITKF